MLGYQYSQDIIWGEGSAKGWNENLQYSQYSQYIILFLQRTIEKSCVWAKVQNSCVLGLGLVKVQIDEY